MGFHPLGEAKTVAEVTEYTVVIESYLVLVHRLHRRAALRQHPAERSKVDRVERIRL